jgi:hypothetical protein
MKIYENYINLSGRSHKLGGPEQDKEKNNAIQGRGGRL